MTPSYSSFQLAIFDFVANGTGSAIVDAKAGSGKTTTIVAACSHIPQGKSVLFLAFNKAIVEELKTRLPVGVSVATYNAIGFRAWKQSNGVSRFLKVEANKVRGIIREKFSRENGDLYGAFVAKMVGLAKSNGLTTEDSDDVWFEIADHHALYPENEGATIAQGIYLAKRTLEESIRQAKQLIDFDDQVYMPWLTGAAFERFDFVIIDEAQDTNNIQKELLKRMLNPGGRLIAVGDPNQAIYGFRGADAYSMKQIAESFEAVTLPLSISYRCAPAIIRAAQAYVPSIEWNPARPADEGTVDTLPNYSAADFTANDAVLCRLNAPLLKMAYGFIQRGKGVNFLGRDLGAGLKLFVEKMKAKTIASLETKMVAYVAKETAKLIAKDREEQIQQLNDKVACIEIIIANLPVDVEPTVGELLNAIDALFEQHGRGVTLCSIHKSKGREFPDVFILDPQLMPSKFARKDWQKDQENNLIYVAITRAQQALHYITSDCWRD